MGRSALEKLRGRLRELERQSRLAETRLGRAKAEQDLVAPN